MASAEDTITDQSSGPAFAGSLATRAAFLLSGLFLLAGIALSAFAAATLVWPDLLSDQAMLTYGRVFPAAGGALVFGFLTLGLIGVAYHAVPRLTGAPLAMPLPALGLVLLTAAGAGAGVAFVLMGENAGGRWTEFPLIADGVLAVAALGVAGLLAMTARRGGGRAPLAAWYLVAAPVWFFLGYVAGAIPGLDGMGAEIQTAFSGTAVFGLWLAGGGVGAAYVAVSLALPDAAFHERLGRIGFWSLTFTWAWTSGRLLQFGPTKDWIETVPVIFGAAVVVAVVTIATDFFIALRGRDLRGSAPVRMAVTGLGFLLAATLVAFVGSLRSVSAVLRFTPFEAGYEHLLVLGAATLLLLAAVVAIVVDTRGRAWGSWWARFAFWPIALGAGIAAASRFVGGFQQGFGWLAGVQSQAYDNLGDGFALSSDLETAHLVQVVGLGLVALGALAFFARLALLAGGGSAETSVPAAATATAPVDGVLRKAVAGFALAALATLVFPILDSQDAPTLLADTSRNVSGEALRGRDIYIAEGCAYCHTQQVRTVVTDLGLGPASMAGDYAYDPIGLAGWARMGPDLTHQGSRDLVGSAIFIRERLADPRSGAAWSVMPSYGHLGEADLVALSIYVAGLE